MSTYNWDQISKKFGLKDHGDVGKNFNLDLMKDSTEKGDGTFQLGDSGTAYLDKDTYEKNKNSDETWKHYADVYGEEAASSKREGNPEGLSASAFDAMMDRLHKGSGDEGGNSVTEKIVHSPEIQDAKERVKNWEDSVASGEQSEGIFGSSGDDPVNQTGSADNQTKQAANAFIAREKRDVAKMLNEDIKV